MNSLRILFLVTVGWVSTVSAQIWSQTSAINTNWGWLASSADGTKLVALNGSGFFTTTNSGASWQIATNQPVLSVAEWSSLAISADGRICVAAAFYSLFPPGGNGGIFVSTNSGLSWARTTNLLSMTPVACSADGSKMVAAGNSIYTSTNSGVTWGKTSAPSASWSGLASSTDGNTLVAAINGGSIYRSTNSGVTWSVTAAPSKNWFNIVSSTDGNRLAAVDYNRAIYTSTNAGTTWISNNLPVAPWHNITASADGTKLAAVATNGYLFTSTNFGATWYSNSVPTNYWLTVASSADGGKLAAAAYRGGIYTSYVSQPSSLKFAVSNQSLALSWTVPSTNYVVQQATDLAGVNWMNLTNIPVLNVTNLQYELALPMTNDSGFYRLKTL